MWSGTGDFLRSTSKLYHPTLLRTTWPLQTIWFSLNFGSYGILTWINTLFIAVHLDNVYFNAFLFAASNLPGNIVSGLFMDYTGRTCMLVTSSCSCRRVITRPLPTLQHKNQQKDTPLTPLALSFLHVHFRPSPSPLGTPLIA
jgi:hypothetical protein